MKPSVWFDGKRSAGVQAAIIREWMAAADAHYLSHVPMYVTAMIEAGMPAAEARELEAQALAALREIHEARGAEERSTRLPA